MDGFVGEIRLLPYIFNPLYWYPCNGGLLPIQSNQALFAVIGTLYGGDGRTTLGVPNLNGRTAVGAGNDPVDVFDPALATFGGNQAVTLNLTQVPSHDHTFVGATLAQTARSAAPAGNFVAPVAYLPASGNPENAKSFAAATAGTAVVLNPATLSSYPGTSGAHENRQPFVAMQYCICLQGEFPMRN